MANGQHVFFTRVVERRYADYTVYDAAVFHAWQFGSGKLSSRACITMEEGIGDRTEAECRAFDLALFECQDKYEPCLALAAGEG